MPAKTGVLVILFASLSMALHSFAYSFTSITTDAGTRAYLLSLFNDLFPCFISPIVVLFGAPTVRRQFNKIKILSFFGSYDSD